MRRRKQVFKKVVATTLAIIMSLGSFQMRVNADEGEEDCAPTGDTVYTAVTEQESYVLDFSEFSYENEQELVINISPVLEGTENNDSWYVYDYDNHSGYNWSYNIFDLNFDSFYCSTGYFENDYINNVTKLILKVYPCYHTWSSNNIGNDSLEIWVTKDEDEEKLIDVTIPVGVSDKNGTLKKWENYHTVYYYMDEKMTDLHTDYDIAEGDAIGSCHFTQDYFYLEDKEFAGWKTEGDDTLYLERSYDIGDGEEYIGNYVPTKDTVFIAQWNYKTEKEDEKNDSYTITFISEEGYINGKPDLKERNYSVQRGDSIEKTPELSRDGYMVVGWKSEKTGKEYIDRDDNSIYGYIPVSDETFIAIWKEAYTITFKSMEGYIFGNPDDKEYSWSVEKGASMVNLYTNRPGYVLVGWKSEKTGKTYSNMYDDSNAIHKYIPTSDEVFIAVWEEAYTITFKSSEGYIWGDSDQKEVTHSVKKGRIVDYSPDTNRLGYVLVGWKSEKTGKTYSDTYEDNNSIYKYIPISDESFTAIWGKAYILTFISSEGYIEGGADSKEVKFSVEKGKALNDYVSYDRPGYVITGWKSEKNGRIFDYYRNEIYEYVPTSDETFTAIWEEAYTITFKSEEGYFNENPDEKEETYSVEKGKTLNYGPYLKRPGYIVIGWKSEKTGKTYIDSENSIYNYIPESDESFTAIWKEAYTVTYKSEEGYLWNLESETEYSNSIVKGNAINDNGAYVGRNPGKCFVGWLKEGTNELYLDNESHYVSDSERIYNDYGVKKDNEKEKYIWNYVPTSDTTFVAKWTDNVYKMTYDPNGGEIYGADSYVITKGSKIGYDYFDSYYGIKRDGYVLTGYKVKETGELLSEGTAESAKQYIEDYIPKSDITLIAQWEKACTITFKSDIEFEDRGSMTSEEKVKECKITNAKGKKMNSIPNIYRPGYVVAGYELEGTGKVFDVLSSGVGENSIWDYVTEKDATFKVLWKETYTISIKNEGSKLETYDNYIQYYEIPKSYDLSYLDSYYFGYYYPVAKDKKAFAGYRIEGDRSGKVYKCTGDASYDSGEFYKIVPTSDMTFVPAWVDGYYVSVDGDGGWHYAGKKGKYEKYNGKYECYKLDVDKYVIEKNTDLVIGNFYDWGIFDEGAMYKEGCDFVGWTVVGKEDKIYKFGEPIRVDSDMTIKAVWKEKSELNFSDVKDTGKFYYKPVYWAADKGITTGYKGTDTFGVDDSCTRAQFVTFLWRYYGCPEPTTTKNFSDVKEGKFYYKAVMWAAESGITTGYKGTDKFGVDDYCTREQCVTFIYRAANTPKVSEADTKKYGFDDSKKGYYADAVTWAAKNEITNGVNKTTFGVGKLCTRGQLVTFLYRFANTEN